MALREIVPAATARLPIAGSDAEVTLSTVLPAAWAGMVRLDGRRFLGLQVHARSGDVSRDLAAALALVLEAGPGTPVVATGMPGPGPRLQDLLDPTPIEVELHDGFDYWVDGTAELDPEVAESMERANASIVPTARVAGQQSAYWCGMKARGHLRWVMPHDEEPLLDALARLSVAGRMGLGAGTRYVGSFRAHGLLAPVWDLPLGTEAGSLEEPAAAFRTRLDDALAASTPLTIEERRARSGLLSRQLTLR